MRVKFLVIAAALMALSLPLVALAATVPNPKPDVIVPCLCPFKSPTLCHLVCG